jgi:hypothetical protein
MIKLCFAVRDAGIFNAKAPEVAAHSSILLFEGLLLIMALQCCFDKVINYVGIELTDQFIPIFEIKINGAGGNTSLLGELFNRKTMKTEVGEQL